MSIKIVLLFLATFIKFSSYAQEAYSTFIKHLNDKTLCLEYQKNNRDTVYIGSAILIAEKNHLFVVTAAHNIENAYLENLNIIFIKNDTNRFIPYSIFTKNINKPVLFSQKYDLTIIRIEPINQASLNSLLDLSIPLSQVSTETSLIKKGAEILGIGYYDRVSNEINTKYLKNIIETNVEYEIQNSQRADTHTATKLFFLHDAAMRGMSGGPVFIKITGPDKRIDFRLIGIFHGSAGDTMNRFHASVTPLMELKEMILKYFSTSK